MKIHFRSDTHHEFGGPPDPLPADVDVIVLAGDIDVGPRGVKWGIREAERMGIPILYVPGNHEFYAWDVFPTLEVMRNLSTGTGLHLLDMDERVIAGVRFLGATLWTDYRADPATPQAEAMSYARHHIADHDRILFGEISLGQSRYFTPENALELHRHARAWLQERLAAPFEGPTVVITHHGPSPACQNPKYPAGPVSAAFWSDLEDLVAQADLWIYGHTHACLDTQVRGTRLVSNQPGYPSEVVPGWDPGKLVVVG